jgi:hypothetical protein
VHGLKSLKIAFFGFAAVISLPLFCDIRTFGSGAQHLLDAEDTTLPMGDETRIVGNENKLDPVPFGKLQEIVCSTQDVNEAAMRQLEENPALYSLEEIYPGQILQGKFFAEGNLAPISALRAPGTLVISGASLFPGESRQAQIFSMNKADAQAGVDTLIQGISAPAAMMRWEQRQVYSTSNLNFELSLGGTLGEGTVGNGRVFFKIDESQAANHVLVRFFQIFYTISVQPPANGVSFFADNANFEDPHHQIGADNPPLYISSVSYGRQILFLASSCHAGNELQGALNAAINAPYPVPGRADTSLTLDQKKTLLETSVQYVALGGASEPVLHIIDGKDGVEGFIIAIRALMANNGIFDKSTTPGVPVSYTVRYLLNNSVAGMLFHNSYVQKDCKLVPVKMSNFSVKIVDVDHRAHVKIERANDQVEYSYIYPGEIDLSQSIAMEDKDSSVQVWLDNHDCSKWHLNVHLLKDGAVVDTFNVRSRWYNKWCTGKLAQVHWLINPAKGKWQRTYAQ